MSCGSGEIFDQALIVDCSLQLLKDDVVLKEFDLITTSVTRSTKGNLKLTNNQGTSIVILSEDDIIAMGFEDEAEFTTFYNAGRAACLGGGGSITTRTAIIEIEDDLETGQGETVTVTVSGLVLGENNNVVLNTDITSLGNIEVISNIVANNTLKVTITNYSGVTVTIPTLNFNIFTL